MIKQIVILISAVLTLTCCKHETARVPDNMETPKALEEKSGSLDVISKRGDGDLVETLYAELVEKTPVLKELEVRIDDVSKSEGDSTKSFDAFDSKNKSYYNSASGHAEQIKDSVLREKIKELVATSLGNYNSYTSRQKDILKSIESKKMTLSDLHIILKITKTLAVIEKFQKDNQPSINSLEGYLKQINGVIKNADSVLKK